MTRGNGWEPSTSPTEVGWRGPTGSPRRVTGSKESEPRGRLSFFSTQAGSSPRQLFPENSQGPKKSNRRPAPDKDWSPPLPVLENDPPRRCDLSRLRVCRPGEHRPLCPSGWERRRRARLPAAPSESARPGLSLVFIALPAGDAGGGGVLARPWPSFGCYGNQCTFLGSSGLGDTADMALPLPLGSQGEGLCGATATARTVPGPMPSLPR